jgi:hypothetical protein
MFMAIGALGSERCGIAEREKRARLRRRKKQGAAASMLRPKRGRIRVHPRYQGGKAWDSKAQ